MKNLHLISTDKPSRLYKTGKFLLLDSKAMPNNTLETINQNIYITNLEEIKEGDWTFNGESPYKWTKDDVEDYLYNQGANNYKGCKKIILTTDANLIKDGVQAIDDEFLEWFVKNSNCESVNVVKCRGYLHLSYMIMIPQEEPKQTKCYCGHTTYCDCGPLEEPQQETLEKGVDKYFKLSHSRLKNEQQKEYERELFIAGAKWQMERSYSEEEVIELLNKREDYINQTSSIFDYISAKEWFNKFKNK